jgi:hypothetical protein
MRDMSRSSERDADWPGKFNTGMAYGFTDDLPLTTGVDIGLTPFADERNFFAGLAWRF